MSEARPIEARWFDFRTWVVGFAWFGDPGYFGQLAVHLGPLVSVYINWKEGRSVDA